MHSSLPILIPFSALLTYSANMLLPVTFALVAAAAAVSASPHKPHAKTATLPLKHVSQVSSIKSMVQQGQARLRNVNKPTASSASPHVDMSEGSITNQNDCYVAPVTIGDQTWDLIVDTGCTY
jgi:hypothetical protein